MLHIIVKKNSNVAKQIVLIRLQIYFVLVSNDYFSLDPTIKVKGYLWDTLTMHGHQHAVICWVWVRPASS